MNKNILIGVLVAIIVALVVFFGLQSNKTPTQTPAITQGTQQEVAPVSNQAVSSPATPPSPQPASTATKTYTNPQYGFSFAYPSGWETPQGNFNGTDFELSAKESIVSPFLSYYPSGSKLSLNDFVNGPWGHSTTDTPKQITVAGQKAYEFSYVTTINGRGQSDPLFNQQVGFQGSNGGFYVINFSVPLTEQAAGIVQFNQLLASFSLGK